MTAVLLDTLRRPGPLITVSFGHHEWTLVRRRDGQLDRPQPFHPEPSALKDIFVFLTDDAVGSREEENLGHLAANVGSDVPLSRLVPFLTCKHTIEHCLLYADRAYSLGFEALTVVGGDTSVGPPRCVAHAYMLRQRIRERQPGLSLGGWANPHRDVRKQVEYLRSDDFTADFYLTQVVSHHSADRVERSSRSAIVGMSPRREYSVSSTIGVPAPARSGVWERFFPVPADELPANSKRVPRREEVLGKTLDALRAAGAEKVTSATWVTGAYSTGSARRWRAPPFDSRPRRQGGVRRFSLRFVCARSSVGLERLPTDQEAGGSSPTGSAL